MSAKPDKPAHTPGSLFEAGLAYLDEAVLLSERSSPNFSRATMAATLAVAHLTAAQTGFQIARGRREANGQSAPVPSMSSELRHCAAMNGWAEISSEPTLVFAREPEGESPWQLEVTLRDDRIAGVLLNGMFVGNSQAFHALRLHGAHRHDDGSTGDTVAWQPSPEAPPTA